MLRPPSSTREASAAASDGYKRQALEDVAAHVLRRLVGSLVTQNDKIQIQTTSRSRIMVILKVDIVDYGKVIGKGGATVCPL